MMHQAFLDEHLERGLHWHGSIPYGLLSEQWRCYEERAMRYIVDEMIKHGMIKEEFKNLIGSNNGKEEEKENP
jgi:hypothetical protein